MAENKCEKYILCNISILGEYQKYLIVELFQNILLYLYSHQSIVLKSLYQNSKHIQTIIICWQVFKDPIYGIKTYEWGNLLDQILKYSCQIMPNLFKIYDNINFKYKSQSNFGGNRSRFVIYDRSKFVIYDRSQINNRQTNRNDYFHTKHKVSLNVIETTFRVQNLAKFTRIKF